jgi:hypothetical protein
MIKPFEVVFALVRFEQHPRENPDADQVDSGLFHQGDVFSPDGDPERSRRTPVNDRFEFLRACCAKPCTFAAAVIRLSA